MTSPQPPDERAQLLIEMWKQTVSVQQHFNELCWRIRGLALTALTAVLGAAGLAAKEPIDVGFFGGQVHLSTLIAAAGCALWLAFGYVDRNWYHRLLKGASKHAGELETALRDYIPETGLSTAISKESKYSGWFGESDSTRRLGHFYGLVAALLLVLAIGFQASSFVAESVETTPGDSPPPTSAPARTSAPQS